MPTPPTPDPDTPGAETPAAAPAEKPDVSAMDRVQDRSDYLDARYERDYNKRYVEAHGDHSGFRGTEETDAEFAAKNPAGADPEAHRATYEVLGDEAPEPLPDEIPDEVSIGHVFLDPDAPVSDAAAEDATDDSPGVR